MPRKSKAQIEKELTQDLKKLTKEVKKLKKLEFVKVLNKPGRLMWLSLLKGMMTGLGSVLGATVLVALLIFIISRVSLVPIVGDFITEVLDQVNLTEELQPSALEPQENVTESSSVPSTEDFESLPQES